jgi:SAM-dependent methyltransferase
MPYKELFSPYVSKYVGADLNLNPKADVHFDFNSKTDLSDQYADLILSSQVLEHVDDVDSYLSESYRLLKDNGYLILSTHGYWIYHPTPGDYWRWTASGLQKTIEKHGYEIVEFTGIMGLMASGLQLFQFGLVSKFKNKYLVGATNYFFQRLVMFFDKFSSDKDRQIDASLYILVAQKKIK